MLLSRFHPLSPAEDKLLAECTQGTRITIGDGELPEETTPETTIRAEILRLLLTGTDAEFTLHDKGLRLRGAWITGTLDLQGASLPHGISLTACHVDAPIEMVSAKLKGLSLSDCFLSGLSADYAHFDGAVFLRAGSVVKGEISLASAHITGDLQICDAAIDAPGQDAIFAPSLAVNGSAFLGNYPYNAGTTTLTANAALFFSSLHVAGDLFVTNCALAPQQSGAIETIFHATEEHGPSNALSLARARISGLLYLRNNEITGGGVSLAGAHATRLNDEPDSRHPIRLDGLTYDDFSRHAKLGLAARLDWLERRPPDTPFTAQPYEQLARVLRQMGHRDDAREVLMRKERTLRAATRAGSTNPLARAASWLTDTTLRSTIGYGYRPGRALLLAVVLIAALGFFFQKVWTAGDMAPGPAPILISKGWIDATRTHPDNPAAFWAAPGEAGQDFETFHPYAYATDVVIPIINLGQESAWAPSTSRSPWGYAGWWIRWFAKALGWLITALGAAAITGMVRND